MGFEITEAVLIALASVAPVGGYALRVVFTWEAVVDRHAPAPIDLFVFEAYVRCARVLIVALCVFFTTK